jgi:hypothetical protein
MWRKLLSRAHPDAGGEHELFVWASAVKDYVCGGAGRSNTPPRTEEPRRHRTGAKPDSARIDYEPYRYDTHRELVEHAMFLASWDAPPLYRSLIELLDDCYDDLGISMREASGATYKQLAAIAHRAGMSKQERIAWYRFCERIPLSQRMAGHILGRM